MNVGFRRGSKRSRSGSVLICVLVCLGIASIISLGALRTSLTHRRELQRYWQMEQTQWVLEAGWRRALQARLADDQYSGEDWQLAGGLNGELDATVQITIVPAAASQDFVELRVVATLQTKDAVPIVTRRSRSWRLHTTPNADDSLENNSLETEDFQ